MHDVAIVGGGPAGVAAAYFLRESGLDVVVFEAGHEVGGRTRSVSVGGVPSNTGALFVYRGTPSEQLATELGIRTTAFTPGTYGIHVNGATVVDTDNHRLIDRLPISDLAREQLRTFVHTSLQEYERYTSDGRLTDDASGLASQTLASRLVGLEPEVVAVVTAAIKGGSVADPEDLSVQYALRYFASYLAHEQHNRCYPVDGMQAIPQAMAARLAPETIRCDRRVERVTQDPDASGYELLLAGGAGTARARQVVLAVPAPVTQQIVSGLPDWKHAALAAARMPGSTTLCLTADITGLPHLATWSFVAVAGRRFDAIINPSPVLPGAGLAPTVLQLVCYGNSAGYRPDLADDQAGTEEWVEDLLLVAPELRGRVLGAHLQTWEHCFAITTPERGQALARLQEPVDGLHFAGDHTSATAGTHGAYAEARRVADAIISSGGTGQSGAA